MIKLKHLLIKENYQVEGNNFWLSPCQKLYNVDGETHAVWAYNYLISKNSTENFGDPDDDFENFLNNIYDIMYKLGWIRVIFDHEFNKNELYYEYKKGNPPTSKQLKIINDLAIEKGLKFTHDGILDTSINVYYD